LVEESPLVHSKINIDGKDYLVMKPVHADVALISGYKVDKAGNVWYKGTSRNYSTVIATDADVVICEADNVVEIGEIEPENVMTQSIFVDYIVDGGKL
jgi:acetate CoA/acetoacetate CoA-transferase alpha subunit